MSKKWWLVPMVAFAIVFAALFALTAWGNSGKTNFDVRLEYMTDNAQSIMDNYRCVLTLNEDKSYDNDNYIQYVFIKEVGREIAQYAQVKERIAEERLDASVRDYKLRSEFDKISEETTIEKYKNNNSKYQYWFYYSKEKRGIISMDIMLNGEMQHSFEWDKTYTNVYDILCIGEDYGLFEMDGNAVLFYAETGEYRWFDKEESKIISAAGTLENNVFAAGGVLLVMESDYYIDHNSMWHGEIYKSNDNYYRLYINMFDMKGGREIAKFTMDIGENKYFYKTGKAKVVWLPIRS